MKRFLLALKCFFALLFGRRLPAQAAAYLPAAQPAPQPAPQPPLPTARPLPAGAVELLALLQREGRLVDFLEEDISPYGDAQIGAAVRDIHRGCRRVLGEYFAIEPVMPGAENASVEIASGFDPRAIRLTGNVTGQPPYRGILKHHGWRTTRVALPNLAQLPQPAIVAPAEVELS